MARSPRPGGLRGRAGRPGGLLAGTIAAAALAVAGCGSVTAAETASGSSAPPANVLPARQVLCARPAAASKVVIARSTSVPWTLTPHPARPAGPVKASQPATTGDPTLPREHSPQLVIRTVKRAATVRSLAGALCTLPPMLKGPVNCPALSPGGVRLTFTADGRSLPAVTIELSGCRVVSGLGTARRADKPYFWKLLARIAGPLAVSPVRLPVGPVTPAGPLGPVNPGGPDLPAAPAS